MKKHNFRNLKIYQRAINFSVDIYKMSSSLPSHEVYGLKSQIRRAVISIVLNIAEGSGSVSEKEFKRFLGIAIRSDYEVMASLEISLRLNYCSKDTIDKLAREANEIAAMISGFSKSL